jgi:TfoX/Sxy family transcriptional regulator of competence genes
VPYDEALACRIREVLATTPGLSERKMFGGLAFLLDGRMCCGVVRDQLMVRVPKADYDACLRQPHARKMDFTGKPLKGFLYIAADGIKTKAALSRWIARGKEAAGDAARSA